MLARATLLVLVLTTALGACGHATDGQDAGGSDAGVPACALGFLGTPGKPVEMKLTARGADLVSAELTDGARVPLILPPQGGRVLFIGVKATNLAACSVTLTGSFRDSSNQQIRIDARTTNLAPTGDGWGQSDDSDISTFSNIPMCPNVWASTDVFETAFELTVTVRDRAGHTGTKTIQAVPFCGEPKFQAECLCQCKKGYVLGQACADAGG